MVFFINKIVHENIFVVHVCAKYLTVTHTCDNMKIVLKLIFAFFWPHTLHKYSLYFKHLAVSWQCKYAHTLIYLGYNFKSF